VNCTNSSIRYTKRIVASSISFIRGHLATLASDLATWTHACFLARTWRCPQSDTRSYWLLWEERGIARVISA